MSLRVVAVLTFVSQAAMAQVCDLSDNSCVTPTTAPAAVAAPSSSATTAPVQKSSGGFFSSLFSSSRSSTSGNATISDIPTTTTTLPYQPVPQVAGWSTGLDVQVSADYTDICIQSFPQNNPDLLSKLSKFCRAISNPYSLKAVQLIVQEQRKVYFGAQSELGSIDNLQALGCVKAFVDANYDLGNGRAIKACERYAKSNSGVQALANVTRKAQAIDTDTQEYLLQISSDFGAQCVQLLVDRNYIMKSGERAEICNKYQNAEAVQNLQNALNAGYGLTDRQLTDLSK